MHKTGWYLDFRLLFTPSLKHEIPNLVYNLVSLEKKFGAIVNWVLKDLVSVLEGIRQRRGRGGARRCTVSPPVR